MAGLQSVIDKTGFITFNQRKSAGSTISRSGHLKTSVQQGALYRFTVGAPQGLRYSENRALLSELDGIDVTVASNVSLSNFNNNLQYVTEITGGIDSPGIGGGITLNGYSGNVLYANLTQATSNDGQTFFKKGDFIQPLGNTSTYKYPYQITSDVTDYAGPNVSIYVNRPIIAQEGVALNTGGFRLGYNVFFNLTAVVNPTYSVVPHDLIEFSGDFELMETIT